MHYKQIVQILTGNKKIIENYFFMTILQVLNSLFYLLIYPYLIRTLGTESYGLYIFASSISMYFVIFISFGFDLPGAKHIAQNCDNLEKKSQIVSSIFTAKIYLEVASIIIFSILLVSIPTFRDNWIIFAIPFLQTFTSILFPFWFFQGIQKMRVVTSIQLLFKILSLPVIFLTIHTPDDLWIYILIVTLGNVLGGVTSAFIIRFKEKVRIYWVSFPEVKKWIKEAFPFFLSTSTITIKEQSISVIIGIFLGMTDVAIYDLANKIVLVPRVLVGSVNGALFPKIVTNSTKSVIKKIIRYEYLLGIVVILFIFLVGKYIVLLLGGEALLMSYPVALILSITVASFLIVGGYTNFVFIPNNKDFFVSKIQIISLISFFLISFTGLFFIKSIFVLAAAVSAAGIIEIIYCRYLTKKYRLL